MTVTKRDRQPSTNREVDDGARTPSRISDAELIDLLIARFTAVTEERDELRAEVDTLTRITNPTSTTESLPHGRIGQ